MCKKLKKEAEALDYLPYPGETGKRFRKYFKRRLGIMGKSSTMLINEMRLTPVTQGKKILKKRWKIFRDGSQAPQGFVPENNTWPGSSVGRAVD